MKMNLSLSALLIAGFIMFSCASHREGTLAENENQSEDTITSGSSENNEMIQDSTINQVTDSLFASISRGACYGRCPIYKMFIYNDGTVILEGIRFMEPRGKHKGKITKEQLKAFTAMAIEINYFELEDTYDSPVTDIPSVTTSIVIDGVRKQVMRRVGYPERILKFEKLFDDLVTSVDWEMIEAPQD